MNNNDIKLCTVNGYTAHTCGNVAAILTQQFQNKFPKDYFKHVHKSTYIALRQFRDIKNELELKWLKPFLTVQPKLISEKTDANVDMWRRLYDSNIYDLLQPDYHNVKFFRDMNKGIVIDFSVERMKMGFDFTVTLSNEFQQYNILTHMNNNFNIDNPYYNEVILETIIPQSVMKQLSECSGVPIYDENKSVEKFLQYVNKHSVIPITLKLDTASGNYIFHMMIRTSIFQVYSALDMGSPEQVNMTTESYPIGIQLMCEFNYPASFFFISSQEDIDIPENTIDDNNDGTYNLYYTMQQTTVPAFDKDDKRIVITVAFNLDETENNEDEIDISSLVVAENAELLDIELNEINYIAGDYIKSHSLYVYENENLMSNNNYYVDWRSRKLIVKNYKLTNTYRLALYADQYMINKYIEAKKQ